jgi:hypothetical protein
MAGKVRHLEDGEQMALLEWSVTARIPESAGLRVADFLLAVPNGGKRGIREAARFKRLGVKAGVSDLFFAYPCGEWAGLWIEMKKRRKDFRSDVEATAATSEVQKQFHELMFWAGYETAVCYGAEQAMEAITEYLKGQAYVRH